MTNDCPPPLRFGGQHQPIETILIKAHYKTEKETALNNE